MSLYSSSWPRNVGLKETRRDRVGGGGGGEGMFSGMELRRLSCGLVFG